MSWTVVAAKDFKDAGRSKLLWFVTALFVLLVGGLAYGYANFFSTSEELSSLGFLVFLQGSVGLFISIAALLVAYKSIAGERESGTINFLLGLPVSRRDVVVGKVVGRSGVLALALAMGFVVATGVLAAFESSFDPVVYALFALLSIAYATAFVSAAVAVSSITASSSRAAAGAIGLWIFDQLWGTFVLAILVVVNGLEMPETPFPGWFHALNGIGPSVAFSNAARYFLPAEWADQIQNQIGSLPEWYGLVVLAGWIVIPLVLGVYVFRQADL